MIESDTRGKDVFYMIQSIGSLIIMILMLVALISIVGGV